MRPREVAAWFRGSPLGGRFGRDVSWNTVSVAFLGLSGIAITTLIGRFYGPSVLGSFNQTYVVYMLASQLSVLGLHFSVLKHVAQYGDSRTVTDPLITCALVLSFLAAAALATLLFSLRHLAGQALGSPDVTVGLAYALPGVTAFAVNKVQLMVINARRHMRAYAVYQATRYALTTTILAAAVGIGIEGSKLPAVLSIAEGILLLCLLPYTLRLFTPVGPAQWAGWPRRHLAFGLRSFLSGVLTEANTRLDILMLGIFLSDRIVGIYSVAALFAEGITQLFVVLRVNVNPVLTKLHTERRVDELTALIRRGVRLTYLIMGCVLALSILGYPLFIRLLIGTPDFSASWPIFAILAAGIASASGYLPFKMTLIQTGNPAAHTAYLGLIAATNVFLNAALIPVFGSLGAATATAISFATGVLYLKRLARRFAGLTI